MTRLDENYLLWLLKEIQKSDSLWKDELGYAVKLIQQKKEIPFIDNLNKKSLFSLTWMMLMVILLASSLHARGVYQTDKDFLDEVYDNAPPKSKSMMLVGGLRKSVEKILDHPYGSLRIRYGKKMEEQLGF